MVRRTVALVTAPAAEPVTLGEVKAWAKIDSDDENPLLVAAISAARESAENYLRRSLITQTLRLTIDLDGSGLGWFEGVYDLPVTALYGGLPSVLELSRGPVQSITSVTTYGLDDAAAVYSASGYRLDGGRLLLANGYSWPSSLRGGSAAEILYVAGYGLTGSSVPQSIRTAILMHIQSMYDGRIICEMPEGCMRLLKPYRIMDGLAYA